MPGCCHHACVFFMIISVFAWVSECQRHLSVVSDSYCQRLLGTAADKDAQVENYRQNSKRWFSVDQILYVNLTQRSEDYQRAQQVFCKIHFFPANEHGRQLKVTLTSLSIGMDYNDDKHWLEIYDLHGEIVHSFTGKLSGAQLPEKAQFESDKPVLIYRGHPRQDRFTLIVTEASVDVWSEWSPFDVCSMTCEGGTQTRSRICHGPALDGGGIHCSGAPTETRACNHQSCQDGSDGGGASKASMSDAKDDTADNTSDTKSLSGGIVAVIVVMLILLIIFIVAGVCLGKRFRKRRHLHNDRESNGHISSTLAVTSHNVPLSSDMGAVDLHTLSQQPHETISNEYTDLPTTTVMSRLEQMRQEHDQINNGQGPVSNGLSVNNSQLPSPPERDRQNGNRNREENDNDDSYLPLWDSGTNQRGDSDHMMPAASNHNGANNYVPIWDTDTESDHYGANNRTTNQRPENQGRQNAQYYYEMDDVAPMYSHIP